MYAAVKKLRDEVFPEAEHFGPVQLYPTKFLEESFTALFESD